MVIGTAGSFIHTWGESDGQVRQMIIQDVRYQAIQTSRKIRRDKMSESDV
jgi:hypothetical protein